MHIIELIQKKRDKQSLQKEEISFLVNEYLKDNVADYQMSSMLMAICINGMTEEEISFLTMAMLESGEIIKHTQVNKPLIDKHSTGGIGDKISIPLAPAVAACDVAIPMIAGRGLGHTGGTLDKLEAIPGFNVCLSLEQYKRQVNEIGAVIMGQTKDIAPADKRLYALRDVSGTVESIPLIASSIMSKKLAEGIDGLVLDVKFGSGAFMKDYHQAKELALAMVCIGKHMGKKVTAYLTDMDQPLGEYVGNALEIKESIDILKGCGPKDSTELTITLGAEMLLLANKVKNIEDGKKNIEHTLSSGKAFNKFIEIVKAQGGDTAVILDDKKLPRANKQIDLTANSDGFISAIDCRGIGMAVQLLGGGRFRLSDTINPAVGIKMHTKTGKRVQKGDVLCTLHVDDKGVKEALSRVQDAIIISKDAVKPKKLIHERLFNSI